MNLPPSPCACFDLAARTARAVLCSASHSRQIRCLLQNLEFPTICIVPLSINWHVIQFAISRRYFRKHS